MYVYVIFVIEWKIDWVREREKGIYGGENIIGGGGYINSFFGYSWIIWEWNWLFENMFIFV